MYSKEPEHTALSDVSHNAMRLTLPSMDSLIQLPTLTFLHEIIKM